MYAKDIKATKMQCPICSTLVCFECKEEWHEAITCDAAFIKRLGPKSDAERIAFCPICKLKLQKDGGCNHIICEICKYEWCWICGSNFFLPHCDGKADFAGGAVVRIPPPDASPPGIIKSLRLRRHWRETLLFSVVFTFFIMAIPMILVAGTLCA